MSKKRTAFAWLTFRIKHLFVALLFVCSISLSAQKRGHATRASIGLENEVQLEFKNAQWLDSANYCFLSLTLFEERTAPEEPSIEIIEDIQLVWDQYTASINGLKLMFDGKTLEPLVYHHYSDALGDYKQALFLCDDFDAHSTDSLIVEISTIAGNPRQSQAFFFHYQQSVTMPEMNTFCKEAQATEKWLKAWLKRHPEFQDHLVRRW